jgi:hypothetical protein
VATGLSLLSSRFSSQTHVHSAYTIPLPSPLHPKSTFPRKTHTLQLIVILLPNPEPSQKPPSRRSHLAPPLATTPTHSALTLPSLPSINHQKRYTATPKPGIHRLSSPISPSSQSTVGRSPVQAIPPRRSSNARSPQPDIHESPDPHTHALRLPKRPA